MAVKYERDTAWDRMVGFADRWVQASLACRDYRAAINGGVVYRDLGEIEKARDCIVKALDMADDDASRQKAYRLLGVLEYDAGCFEKVIPHYIEALAINPNDAGVLRTLGISHLQLGDKQACLTYLRRYLALDQTAIKSEPSDRRRGVKGVVSMLEKEIADANMD
jgi:tetratricopeptide (TPR) repeat protein